MQWKEAAGCPVVPLSGCYADPLSPHVAFWSSETSFSGLSLPLSPPPCPAFEPKLSGDDPTSSALVGPHRDTWTLGLRLLSGAWARNYKYTTSGVPRGDPCQGGRAEADGRAVDRPSRHHQHRRRRAGDAGVDREVPRYGDLIDIDVLREARYYRRFSQLP